MATATKVNYPDKPGITKRLEDCKTISDGKQCIQKKELYWAVVPKDGETAMKRKAFGTESGAINWLKSNGYDTKGKKL